MNDTPRPRSRWDCRDGPRPCPWVGCRYHLALEVTSDGRIYVHNPRVRHGDLSAMEDTCALDVAGRGPHLLAEIGDFLGVSEANIYRAEQRGLRHAAEAIIPAPGDGDAEA